ncbi:MAG: hypothetical protein BWY91_02355 [bacterium ADurb.BinA028]|nr:MAG: hypothetical protein BWY91_02355 [bacterium ADurb.BinA028]
MEDLGRRAELAQPPGLHDGDPVGHGQGFGLIVGDEHRGDAELVLQPLEEGPRLQPQSGIEVAQWLVEQERRRLAGHRPGECDALLLASGELPRPSLQQPVEPEPSPHPGGGLCAAGLVDLADAQGVGDVVTDRHVREEGVVLEDHGHVAVPRRHLRDVALADVDPTARRDLEPGDRAQQRGLAATGRTEQREELTIVDGQVEPVQRRDVPGVDLGQPLDANLAHQLLIPPWKRNPYRRLTKM